MDNQNKLIEYPGQNNDDERICNECGAVVHSGYCINDGLEYYCSDECLWAWYSEEEYDELCQQDAAYWSEWE